MCPSVEHKIKNWAFFPIKFNATKFNVVFWTPLTSILWTKTSSKYLILCSTEERKSHAKLNVHFWMSYPFNSFSWTSFTWFFFHLADVLYKWELYLTNEQKTQFIFLTNRWKTTFVRALICTWYHLLTCWEPEKKKKITFPSLFWLNDTYAICSEFESGCSWKMSRSIMRWDQHLERNIV